MAIPTKKASAIDNLITSIFGDRQSAIRQDICARCSKPATVFHDELSMKEYTISGLCQACQDEAFAADDEGSEEDDDFGDDVPF